MRTNVKRLSFYVTSSMEKDLDAAKREHYSKSTGSDMIRDLIIRGLAFVDSENGCAYETSKQTI